MWTSGGDIFPLRVHSDQTFSFSDASDKAIITCG